MKRGKLMLDVIADDPPARYRPVAGDKPCKECPFRRQAMAGWLGDATPQSFVIEISMEHPLPCHVTLDYTDPAWLEKWTAQETGRICAGSLILAANMCKLPRDPKFPRLPSDREHVFATPQEFIAHHEASPTRSWELREDAPKEKRMPTAKTKPTARKAKRPAKSASKTETVQRDYVQAVQDELDSSLATEMSLADYIEALEEIQGIVESYLDCARSDQKNKARP